MAVSQSSWASRRYRNWDGGKVRCGGRLRDVEDLDYDERCMRRNGSRGTKMPCSG